MARFPNKQSSAGVGWICMHHQGKICTFCISKKSNEGITERIYLGNYKEVQDFAFWCILNCIAVLKILALLPILHNASCKKCGCATKNNKSSIILRNFDHISILLISWLNSHYCSFILNESSKSVKCFIVFKCFMDKHFQSSKLSFTAGDNRSDFLNRTQHESNPQKKKKHDVMRHLTPSSHSR